MNRTILPWLALCMAGALPFAADASQEPAQQPAKPAAPDAGALLTLETRFIPLKEAPAEEIGQVVQRVMRDSLRVAVDSRTNALILSAEPDALALAQELIVQLDTTTLAAAPVLRHFLLRDERAAGEFAQSIMSLLSPATRVVRIGSNVTLRGTAEDVQLVENLLKEYGLAGAATGPRSLAVTLFVLRTVTPAATPAQPLPPSLAPVVQALNESGFATFELLAPFRVTSELDAGPGRGAEFELKAAAAGELRAMLRGSARPAADGSGASVSVLIGLERAANGQNPPRSVFELETQIHARFGEYVVLAAAPSRDADADSIALVLRIDPQP